MAEYIDKQAAANIFSRARAAMKPQDYHTFDEMNTRDLMLLNAELAIRDIPAADVAPVVHAHWKEIEHEGETTLCECTSCGDWILFHYEYSPNYCPNCGAKMDEEGDGE